MSYSYEVTDNPPMAKIQSNGQTIDLSGPWESVEAATDWAEAYTNQLNQGLATPEAEQ
jgi:hypothetical protein